MLNYALTLTGFDSVISDLPSVFERAVCVPLLWAIGSPWGSLKFQLKLKDNADVIIETSGKF